MRSRPNSRTPASSSPATWSMVGGLQAGTVKSIELGDDGQALVKFSVDQDYAPLPRGTIATVRSRSLSSIAGRSVELVVPPSTDSTEEIPDGGTMSQSETVSEVDLDQLFNTLDTKTVKDFKHVIQGFATAYEGVAPQANQGFHVPEPVPFDLAPGLRRAQPRPARLRDADRRHLEALGRCSPRARQDLLDLVSQPEPGARRDRPRSEAPCRGDLPAARLHAPGQHDLRQPARGARRRRPARQRLASRSPTACGRSSRASAPPPPTPCRRSATSTRSSAARAAPTT